MVFKKKYKQKIEQQVRQAKLYGCLFLKMIALFCNLKRQQADRNKNRTFRKQEKEGKSGRKLKDDKSTAESISEKKKKRQKKQNHWSIHVAKTFPKYNSTGPSNWQCMLLSALWLACSSDWIPND